MVRLIDMFKKADRAELEEARAILAALPATPAPARPVMPADERRQLGGELAARFQAFEAERQRILKRLEAAEKELRETRDRLGREIATLAAKRDSDAFEYSTWRDPTMARLWAERPMLADELIARATAEADALLGRVERAEIPIELGRELPASITNGNSIADRQSALRQLADDVRTWTERGTYGDEAELQKAFDDAYSKLPAVKSLRAVVRESPDPRVRKINVRGLPPEPPAA